MSRSKRKTPIAGITTSASEKKDKQAANRVLRRLTRADPENAPLLREVSDVWSMGKDGKIRFDPDSPEGRKWLRK